MFYVYDVTHDKILTVKATLPPAERFMHFFVKRHENERRDLPALVIVDTYRDAMKWAERAQAEKDYESHAIALYAAGYSKAEATDRVARLLDGARDRAAHALFKLGERVNGVSRSPRSAAIRMLMKVQNP
jgi:hypothetical protein